MLDITKIHLLAVLIYTAASISKKMIKRNLLLSWIRCNETCISYANTVRHPESSAYRPPKMCKPSANTENSRSTLEKPLVPRVTVRFLGNRSKSTFRRDLNFKETDYLSILASVLVFPCRRSNLSSWWFLNETKIKKNNNDDGMPSPSYS